MRTISKRFKSAKNLIEPKQYSLQESLDLLKQTATAKFIESSEVHFCLNLNTKYADQQLRSTIILPHGTGRSIRVAAIISSGSSLKADQLGAERIGSEDLIEAISAGYTDFDVLIAEPDMMPKIAKLGRILGPRGLMPSPKAGTVTTNVIGTIQEFKKGKVEYRVDKTGVVHMNFGKTSFSIKQLEENFSAIYTSIIQNKPSGVKGKYIKKVYICSTMGPAIELDFSIL